MDYKVKPSDLVKVLRRVHTLPVEVYEDLAMDFDSLEDRSEAEILLMLMFYCEFNEIDYSIPENPRLHLVDQAILDSFFSSVFMKLFMQGEFE